MMLLRGKVFLSLAQIRAVGLSLAQAAGIQIAYTGSKTYIFPCYAGIVQERGMLYFADSFAGLSLQWV